MSVSLCRRRPAFSARVCAACCSSYSCLLCRCPSAADDQLSRPASVLHAAPHIHVSYVGVPLPQTTSFLGPRLCCMLLLIFMSPMSVSLCRRRPAFSARVCAACCSSYSCLLCRCP